MTDLLSQLRQLDGGVPDDVLLVRLWEAMVLAERLRRRPYVIRVRLRARRGRVGS